MRKSLKFCYPFFLIGFFITSHLKGQHAASIRRMDEVFDRLKDPATGKIPENIRVKELLFSASLPQNEPSQKSGISSGFWHPAGPPGLGGRTRAIAIDVKDENHLLTGGVTGGIWASFDQGNSWKRVTTPFQVAAVTCLVQDTRAGRTHIWYAGTGEATGSSASRSGAYYLGDGILKSLDNGLTWTPLTATRGRSILFDKDFELCHQLAINTADTSDNLFVATYSGIYRSLNGGQSFSRIRGGSDLFTGQSSYFTDLVITSNGTIYASLDKDGPNGGIWRSVNNGTQWTRITPEFWSAHYKRIAFGLLPNGRDGFYMISSNLNGGQESKDFRGRKEYHSIWRYEFIQGNGAGSGGKWEELSDKLPEPGTQFGRFISQGGYDLYIQVFPADSQIVFLGGTNIWRNDDGLNTKTNTYWIGGYDKWTSLPDFKMYPQHHPDQHKLIFFPSNPKKAISAHDGGLSITENILDTQVVWKFLNNGYTSSQFYTLAMREDSGSQEIMGGLQDNGTWHSYQLNHLDSPWTMPFSGDGSYCFFRSGKGDLLVSKQEGKLYRLNISSNGFPLSYARLDPDSAFNYQFINPFAVDPQDEKIIYVPAKNKIWINSDIEAVPLKPVLDSVKNNLNWHVLKGIPDSNIEISYLMTDKFGRLWVGTEEGFIYKINFPSTPQPVIKKMATLSVRPLNVGCIHVSDKDSNEVAVVTTNYSNMSIFHSQNGGDSWDDAGGNLEENKDGSGNGPSVRWIDKLEMDSVSGWFVATSTGVYSTNKIQGMNTRWVQQGPENIGNVVCNVVKVRNTDGTIAVATHGNGLYVTRFVQNHQVVGLEKPRFQSNVIYPNPVHKNFQVKGTHEGQRMAAILFDMNGRFVQSWPVIEVDNLYSLENVAPGQYLIVLFNGHDWQSHKIIVEK